MCFRNSRRRMLYSAIAAIPLLGLAVVYWLRSVPDAPPPFVLARCKDTKSDAPRVGVSFATQFEASPALFHIHAGTSDSPPIVTGIGIRPLGSTSKLEIVYGSLGAGYFDAVPSLSEHSAEREVYRDDGQVFGKDSWGLLPNGDRWRRVQLRGNVVAKYEFVNKKDADILDRVISSACYAY